MSQRPEGPEFQSDGTVALVIDEKVIQLRRPKIKELKDRAAAARELNTEARVRAQQAMARQTELRDRLQEVDGASDEAAQLYREVADLDAAYAEWRDDAYASWLAATIDLLGDNTLDEDDWPSWFYDTGLPARIMEHWKTSPSGAGPHK